MSTGPLRRVTGILGLIALVPIAVQLATGVIDPELAAQRAAVVAVVVVVLGRLAAWLVAGTLRRVERGGAVLDERDDEVAGTGPPPSAR